VKKEDDETDARIGKLTVNGISIQTPVLWMGTLVKSKPRPWQYFTINNIMVNAYDVISRGKNDTETIFKNGIHNYLDFSQGLIMMDSGGFQLLMRKRKVLDVKKLILLYEQAKPDIGVILDYPLNPSASLSENRKRWEKTLKNMEFMMNNDLNVFLMPVVHGLTISEIRNACRDVRKLLGNDPKLVGIGSLVPLIRSMNTRNVTKRNRKSPKNFIIDAIRTVRSIFPDSFLHVFGVGSVTTMHLMFCAGADSVDSMGWRLKAAYGAIQLPGVGDRFVTNKGNNIPRKVLSSSELEVLSKCECPICSGKPLRVRLKQLSNKHKGNFVNRAIHNAWTFIREEEKFREALQKGFAREFTEVRLKNSPFVKTFEYYLETRGLKKL